MSLMQVFADHIVHHLLCIYAIGASPLQLSRSYQNNTGYQLLTPTADLAVIERLHDQDQFVRYLGDSEHYRDYLIFFKRLISERGVEAVVNEFVFSCDTRSDDFLARMFSGNVM